MTTATFLWAQGLHDAERIFRQAMATADSTHWTILGITFRGGPTAAWERRDPLLSLAALLDAPVDFVFVVEPGLDAACWPTLAALADRVALQPNLLALLVRRVAPPLLGARNDGPVRSFGCSAAALRLTATTELEALCFRTLAAVLRDRRPGGRVVVEQVGGAAKEKPSLRQHPPTAVVIPHRGPPEYLRTCLHFLHGADTGRLAIRVGLDEGDAAPYEALREAHPEFDFFQCVPSPGGPYVIRQLLAMQATEEFLAFQDSDDISTGDRFGRLHAEMAASSWDLIGCHELRHDEMLGLVSAIRFPLDASAALRIAPGHALIHPSSMMRRAAFFRAGGLSTDRTFGYDTQFLLRAFFHLRIGNADDFLYIRRRRQGSLTTSPETGMASPERLRQRDRWHVDFAAIKAGRLNLEDSSLAPVQGPVHCLERLATRSSSAIESRRATWIR